MLRAIIRERNKVYLDFFIHVNLRNLNLPFTNHNINLLDYYFYPISRSTISSTIGRDPLAQTILNHVQLFKITETNDLVN